MREKTDWWDESGAAFSCLVVVLLVAAVVFVSLMPRGWWR